MMKNIFAYRRYCLPSTGFHKILVNKWFCRIRVTPRASIFSSWKRSTFTTHGWSDALPVILLYTFQRFVSSHLVPCSVGIWGKLPFFCSSSSFPKNDYLKVKPTVENSDLLITYTSSLSAPSTTSTRANRLRTVKRIHFARVYAMRAIARCGPIVYILVFRRNLRY